MILLRIVPFVALAAVLVALLATAVWHEGLDEAKPYESPCVMSWDETDATFCILTRRAAAMERQLASQN